MEFMTSKPALKKRKPLSLAMHDLEKALIEGEIEGAVIALPEDERPLHGLAGMLDWRFGGQISLFLKQGSLRGKVGEVAYLPASRYGKTHHLLLVGAGKSPSLGARKPIAPDSQSALLKNLRGLRLERLGASEADLPGISALCGESLTYFE